MTQKGRIALLSESVAHQIAAGEVVQRPASVVKELLENSIDAEATHIEIFIAQSGKNQILVKDDGMGMGLADARLCFSRHATSKIASEKDLYAIRTLGFRGEALASIAAVAKVELKTRTEASAHGLRIVMEASERKKEEEVAMPYGTSISVRSLFFNTPARRSFLKSDAVEMRHIVEVFQQMALSHPEIAFSLSTKNQQNTYTLFCHLERGKLGRRTAQLLGKPAQQHVVPVEQETDYVRIWGYISSPETAKKARGDQFFFVNHRYVRHPYLHHAVLSAYERLLEPGRVPMYVLFLKMDPAIVDVNVHPSKTEVKFEDDKTMYGLLAAAVKRALGIHQHIAPMDFKVDARFSGAVKTLSQEPPADPSADPSSSQGLPADSSASEGDAAPRKDSPAVAHWRRMQEEAALESQYDFQKTLSEESVQDASTREKAADAQKPSRASADMLDKGDLASEQRKPYVFQLHHQYVCKQVRQGLLVVDQVRAYERVLYERFLSKRERVPTQRLIFAQELACSDADRVLMEAQMASLKAMGFAFDSSSREVLRITGIPMGLEQEDVISLFEELLEAFKHLGAPARSGAEERWVRVVARHAAERKQGPLEEEDLHMLLDHLFACEQPYYTPHGKPVVYVLTLEALLKSFNP